MSTPSEALAALRAPFQGRQGRAATPETGEINAERLAAVEAHAVTVRAWNPTLIPGLLQTTRYATAAVRTTAPAIPAGEVHRRAHQRAARVDAFLTRWQQPTHEAVFVVGEQAIRQHLAHGQAHRAQLRQLLNMLDLPNVHVRVMPAGAPGPGRLGQCALYALEPNAPDLKRGARLGYFETPVGGWYTLRSADIALLRASFDGMIEAALNAEDSRSLILEALAA